MREKTYHALYAAAAAALVFGFTPATKVLADEASPIDETTTEQTTQETTTQEATPVVQEDPNVSATPVQAQEQQTYSLALSDSMPGVSVPEMTSYTSGVETPLPELEKDGLKFLGWICVNNSDLEGLQHSIPANITGELKFFTAWDADYHITNGKDATWIKGSQTPLTLKINSQLGNFDKILMNGKPLNENDYKITYVDVGERYSTSYYNNGTIIQVMPSYLESLPVGQALKVHIVYGPDDEVMSIGFHTHCEMDGTLTIAAAQSVNGTNTTNANGTNTVSANTNKKGTSTNAATATPIKEEKSTTTSSVDTGVSSHSGTWFVAALASAIGALGLPILKKRNQ